MYSDREGWSSSLGAYNRLRSTQHYFTSAENWFVQEMIGMEWPLVQNNNGMVFGPKNNGMVFGQKQWNGLWSKNNGMVFGPKNNGMVFGP